MLDQFFEGFKYYDYPSFEVAIFSLLLALVLSTVVAYTYRLTAKQGKYSKSFFQAMVLSSLVTAMIMMAVGNNLAVGFGIIGAVAIIRFRTNIQNPRNIIFMFVCLSVGISTGVYGYAIALAGTMIFCLTALLLYHSPFGGKVYLYEITCTLGDNAVLGEIRDFLKQHSKSYDEVELRKRDESRNRFVFHITIKEDEQINEIFSYLQAMDAIIDLRVVKHSAFEQL